jgi:anti-sigma B factor antagonist
MFDPPGWVSGRLFRGTNPSARMLADLKIVDYALDGRTHVIEVNGQVDLYSTPELKARIGRVLDDGKTRVIIDLTHVAFMDSTGLGVLVGALKRLRAAQGALSVVVTNYDIERPFKLTGLDGSFRLHRTRDDALEELALERAL